MQIREQLEEVFDQAIAAAVEAPGTLELEQAPEAALERPRDEANGDWASHRGHALRPKHAKKNPREIAQIIVDHLPENDLVQSVDIAGPGFINIRLAPIGPAERGAPRCAPTKERLRQAATHPGGRAQDQPGVHIREPDRPPARGSRALGGAR